AYRVSHSRIPRSRTARRLPRHLPLVRRRLRHFLQSRNRELHRRILRANSVGKNRLRPRQRQQRRTRFPSRPPRIARKRQNRLGMFRNHSPPPGLRPSSALPRNSERQRQRQRRGNAPKTQSRPQRLIPELLFPAQNVARDHPNQKHERNQQNRRQSRLPKEN